MEHGSHAVACRLRAPTTPTTLPQDALVSLLLLLRAVVKSVGVDLSSVPGCMYAALAAGGALQLGCLCVRFASDAGACAPLTTPAPRDPRSSASPDISFLRAARPLRVIPPPQCLRATSAQCRSRASCTVLAFASAGGRALVSGLALVRNTPPA